MNDSFVHNGSPIDSQVNIQNNQGSISFGKRTRMSATFERLENEIRNNTTKEVIDDLLMYKTKLDGTKGLEEKLQDGGFGNTFIQKAKWQKETYAKKATKYECYPAAQEIFLNLFARIKNDFDVVVYPLILQGTDVSEILKVIREQIVLPIMEILNENGEKDQFLYLNMDHIYGMLYYLTGMCHLNWKDYDNV